MIADLPSLCARFSAALRAAGVPADAGRAERFARAVSIVEPAELAELYWCARTTLIADPEHIPALDAVFGTVFRGLADPAEQRGQPGEQAVASPPDRSGTRPGGGAPSAETTATRTTGEPVEVAVPALASDVERLAGKDFAELESDELAQLAELMRDIRLSTPLRRSRRTRASARGAELDPHRTLRAARRTAAQPIRLVHKRRTWRRRKLVVLLDISGSMQHYARAMLQLLYCARDAADAEVFTFATRLTRLTRQLRGRSVHAALAGAGQLAQDWSGGTRIAAALREFTDSYGRRGMARGAVVVIVSDGWETGDAAELGAQLARLSRLTHRIVWANPRTARSGYRPLVGGMAAAWPYCDAVVSAHRLDALAELLSAIRGR